MITIRSILPAWLLLSVFALGCGSGKSLPDAEQRTATPVGRAGTTGETWEVLYMGGARVGSMHQSSREAKRDGQPVLKRKVSTSMAMQRFGEDAEMSMQLQALESLDGQLISFEETTASSKSKTTGRIVDGELIIEINSGGKTRRHTLPWPEDAGGFFALEDSLRGQPMKPGERRTFRYLQPMVDSLGTEELVAVDYEPTELLSGSHELLRINCELRIDGSDQVMSSTRWSDRTGEVLKTETPAMQLVSYRSTEAEATADENTARYDVGLKSIVPLAQPFANPRASRRAVYRVELRDGDPAAAFVVGLTQQIRSTGPHTAEIAVSSVDPRAAGDVPAAAATKPTPDDLAPNSLIQSDDPAIVALVPKAAGKAREPAEVAIALEQYVDRHFTEKNYKTPLASASEVVETHAGDCTEHAVLLAALARASGIPARVAIGLVYSAKEKGFAYHMWNEVYLDGRWVPLDATLGEGRVSADHLKLADSDLPDASGLVAFMPVQNVLGRLKIELVEAE